MTRPHRSGAGNVGVPSTGDYVLRTASMIDRYTIKFGPAVSQKELEKA
jgi:hypothetical protein